MSFFNSMSISASALTAQRLRMDVISDNVANANTTRTADGGPYRRRAVLFEQKTDDRTSFSSVFDRAVGGSAQGRGVRVAEIVTDSRPGPLVYDPHHPDANQYGYLERPNVNIVEEMVNMISASRAYEANVTAMNTTKTMITRTLEIANS